jgi:WD40 repeat protein
MMNMNPRNPKAWPNFRVSFNRECTLGGHTDYVRSVAYSPDGKHVVSGSEDNTVKVWDAVTGEEVSHGVLSSPYRLLLRTLELTCVFGP